MPNPDYDAPSDSSSAADTSSAPETSADPDDSASASDPGDDDSSDTGVPVSCGNGIVEGVETCDDANDVDGDGCNVDCTDSGTHLWSLVWDGGQAGFDTVHDVALLADGSVVTGGVSHTASGWQAEQARISTDGTMVWNHLYSVPDATDTSAWGAARFGDGSVLAGNGDNQMLFVHALDGDGALVDEVLVPGRVHDATSDGENVWVAGQLGDETAAVFQFSSALDLVATFDEPSGSMPTASVVWAVAQGNDRVIVSGETYEPRRGFVRALYQGDGGLAWEYDVLELGGDSDAAYGATIIPGGAVATVGDVRFGSESNGWLMRRDTGGRLLDDIEQEDLGNYHGVAIGPSGEIAVAGWVDLGLGKIALLVKYAVDGSLAWRREITGELPVGDHKAWTVAIREDHVIIVGGELAHEVTGLDAWVAAYTP